MSGKEFDERDKVTWKSHGSTAEGTVEKKITSDTEEAGMRRTSRTRCGPRTDDPHRTYAATAAWICDCAVG